MALHPRLGEESPLWTLARIVDAPLKKALKAGKAKLVREKVGRDSLWFGLGDAYAVLLLWIRVWARVLHLCGSPTVAT